MLKVEGLCLVDASINWQFLSWELCSVLSWEFCSNGTTCMCIVESHLELYIISCYVDVLVD